jgi:hypothetical protein
MGRSLPSRGGNSEIDRGANDPHEGRFESVVDAGLYHCRAIEAARFWGVHHFFRAKILKKRCEGFRRCARRDHAIVITCECKNRGRIVSVWLIKLIIVIHRLAEAVDDIAKVEEERR